MLYREMFEPVNAALCCVLYGRDSRTPFDPLPDTERILIEFTYELNFKNDNIAFNGMVMMAVLNAIKSKVGHRYTECAENMLDYIQQRTNVNKLCALITWGMQHRLLELTTSSHDRGPLIQRYHEIMLGLFKPDDPIYLDGIKMRSYAQHHIMMQKILPDVAPLKNYVADALAEPVPPAALFATPI